MFGIVKGAQVTRTLWAKMMREVCRALSLTDSENKLGPDPLDFKRKLVSFALVRVNLGKSNLARLEAFTGC